MKWTGVSVLVSWRTMDPGVMNCDGTVTKILREDIKEGGCLPYKDPSGVLPSIQVLEVKYRNLKIQVSGQVMEIEPGGTYPLCRTGYNYTDFALDISLDCPPGPLSLEIDDPLATARDRYRVFAIDEGDIERLKQEAESDDPGFKESWYLLGRWYWLTRPERGAVGKAKVLFRKAAKAGCADGWLGLAKIARFANSDHVDLDKYLKLRDKAIKEGSMAAELAYCLDLAEGIGCEADLEAAVRFAQAHIGEAQSTPPEWYDVLGTVLLRQGKKAEAGNKFATAGIKGYVTAYDGLLNVSQSWDVMMRAEKAGCGRVYLWKAEYKASQYKRFRSESSREEVRKAILGHLEMALLMGDASAASSLSEIFEEGLYGFAKNKAKAQKYAKRVRELGDTNR